MSTEINQILNRLNHLDKEKSDDLNKLKKIVLTSTQEEIRSTFDQLDLKDICLTFKKLLKSDEKFIYEDVQDIFTTIQQTLGDEEFYNRFENVIKNDILNSDSTKLKSIILKLLLNGCKNTKVQTNLINNLLNLIIENFGDKDEVIGKRSCEILTYLSTKNDLFLNDYLFNQTNYNQLNLVKNKNEIIKFRYFEFLINLALIKDTFLQNQFIQHALKELIDLTCKSDDPLIVRNCLEILNKLIGNDHTIQYLDTSGYFNFISTKILNPESDLFINLLMPGYLETFAKIGSIQPQLIENYPNIINQIIEFILTDNFTDCSIQTIGLIGRQSKGKLILNSNTKFIEQLLPKLGQLLISNEHLRVVVLNCLCSLFDLNDRDATVEISNLLDGWYSKLMSNRKKLTEQIFLLCKQVFPEIHLNTLILITILCKHSWAQKEFAQLNTFLDYILNANTEHDYESKKIKFKLVAELASNPFTKLNFGALNHSKIRKVFEKGEFYVEQDVSVAVEGL